MNYCPACELPADSFQNCGSPNCAVRDYCPGDACTRRRTATDHPDPTSTGREAIEALTLIKHSRDFCRLLPSTRQIINDALAHPVAARDLDVEAERREFEAWSKRVAPAYGFDKDERGQYVAYPVHAGWAAWQARAARAPSNNSPAGADKDK